MLEERAHAFSELRVFRKFFFFLQKFIHKLSVCMLFDLRAVRLAVSI